jgi:hypothetical protein
MEIKLPYRNQPFAVEYILSDMLVDTVTLTIGGKSESITAPLESKHLSFDLLTDVSQFEVDVSLPFSITEEVFGYKELLQYGHLKFYNV